MVLYTYNPSTWRPKKEDCCKVEASLGYIGYYSSQVSKTKKKKKIIKEQFIISVRLFLTKAGMSL